MAEYGKMISFPGSDNDEESAGRRVKRRTRRYRLTKLYIVLLVLALIAAIVIGYFIYVKSRIYETYSVISTASHDIVDGTKILEFNGSILTYSKDGANAVDVNGKLLWNQTFDMQNPMVAVCGESVAFADYGGSRIYYQSAKGETAVVTTDKPIRKITVASSGYVAAVLEDIDVTWIYMYNINGTTISYFRTTMEKSGYPVDISLSPSGELMCVSYYYVDCNDVKSSVAFFNFGSVGQNSIDNYVSGYNYSDTLVPYVQFMDDKTAFAVSTDRVAVYSGEHKPLSVSDWFHTEDVLSVFHSSDAIAIIYSNALGGTKYKMALYDKVGKLLSEKAFDFDYSGVSFGYGNVILYGDTSLYVGTYLGEKKFEGIYEKPMHLVVPTQGPYKYAVLTGDSIDIITLE